ncbi:MAG: pilus assembly PilX N-terminal domain-containing protein [Desulfotignum sp.]|nr:pilus assembly PilX N-terminal domain-containing protein [Desulfotignum sp.]
MIRCDRKIKKVSSVIQGNENGSALVLVMIIMAVLTIIGVSVINTATVENSIVHNERIYQENFYLAESAALEAVQQLDLAPDDKLNDKTFSSFVWLKKKDDNLDMSDIANWNITTNAAKLSFNVDFPLLPQGDFMYAVVQTGIVPGASLDMTATSHSYGYVVRGYSESNNGRAMIEIGYQKRH